MSLWSWHKVKASEPGMQQWQLSINMQSLSYLIVIVYFYTYSLKKKTYGLNVMHPS